MKIVVIELVKRLAMVVVFFGVFGLLPGQQAQAAVEVFVSIPPQKWLSDRIGGEHLVTEVLVEKGQDPHTFEPRPKQIGALGRAKLYFTIGLEFEAQIVAKLRQSTVNLQIVDTTVGLEKIAMAGHSHHEDADHSGVSKDEHGEADHGTAGLDPHVWLSPPHLKEMAAAMAKAITAVDPAHSQDYAANLARLTKDLDALDHQLATELKPYQGATFFVFHPSFGYFAKRYGLVQEAVEVEGKSPSPRQLSALIAEAKADGVKVIFVQPQFDERTGAAVAAAIGGAVVPLDALAEDVAGNLKTIAGKISSSLAAKQ